MSGPILFIGGGLILLLLIAGIVVTLSGEKELVEERIEQFMEASTQEMEFGESEDSSEEKTSALTEWIDGLVVKSDYGDRIAEMLARADMKFRPGEYVALVVISAIFTGALGFLFGGGPGGGVASSLFALGGLVGGAFLPRMFIGRQQAKRMKDFSDQLPDMLNLMVNGLRAGFSTMQALEAVSKEMPAPISSEFRRVVQEMQLGIPMEKAFENLLVRIPSDDLDLMITAINVQREVGGNLAEVLETISHTIRERIRIKGEIKTLTTQVVYSGRFLSLMPIVLSFLLYAINPEYMGTFFDEPKWLGITMLTCSGIMIVIGYFVMNKIADIEV